MVEEVVCGIQVIFLTGIDSVAEEPDLLRLFLSVS